MRFSFLFQQAATPPDAAGERKAAAEKPPAPAAPAPDLPDDLDARVRLIGEWQQLEG